MDTSTSTVQRPPLSRSLASSLASVSKEPRQPPPSTNKKRRRSSAKAAVERKSSSSSYTSTASSSSSSSSSFFQDHIRILFGVACLWTITSMGLMEYVKEDMLSIEQEQEDGVDIAEPKISTAWLRSQQHPHPYQSGPLMPNIHHNNNQHSNNKTSAKLLQPVDITYVDVSNGNREHPHRGAKDEGGQWGYRHDETVLRRYPPNNFNYFNNQSFLEQACIMRDANYHMIHEQVSLVKEETTKANYSSSHAKLLCIVYTTEHSHANKIPALRETWGPHCDGFIVASTKTDVALDTVEIPHQGDEQYENIWQKIRAVWSYVYDNYYQDYDWFHIGGEDMFVIPENLRSYLESYEIVAAAKNVTGGTTKSARRVSTTNSTLQNNKTLSTLQMPLFLGGRLAFEGDKDNIFNQGGGGYTLNKAALKALVVEGLPNYYTGDHTFTEDVMIAKVLKELGILPYDTRDADGGERYNPYSPGYHYDFRLPHDKYHNKMWYAAYQLDENTLIEGAKHCSPHSVSFHYIKVDLMYRLYALLYNLCPTGR